jgi:uncharacterized membrane protein (UPF0182 family)
MADIFDEFLDELKRRQSPQGGTGSEGPDDEGPPESTPPRIRRIRRDPARPRSSRLSWIVGAIVVLLFLLLTIGVGFWTDVLWYRSVGYEPVFWTRVGAGGLLFVGGLVVALAVFLGNLWLASRLAPPADPDAATGLRDFLERINDVTASADPRRAMGPRPVATEPVEVPDLAPIATLALGVMSVIAALGVGAAVGSAWETVLLWINRVPFGAGGTASVTTDPIFGRDISWFLFDLPFLRDVQAVFNAIVLGALVIVFLRYLAGAPRSGIRFPTAVRAHLAILAGLYLLSVAFGYQLDKFELVYSTRGVASGVSYTDANAQFFALDLMTVLSAFAAAFLVGGAFTRWTWPLGVVVVTWFIASFAVGRIYPEAIQRLVVEPNKLQREEPYIAKNIAMTRLAYGLDTWEQRGYTGDQPLTQGQISEESATFRNARLWDYRPLGDTLDQLQTVRRYYDFVDVDTDRYMLDGQMRQVMLSARELDLAANPNATGWVNQRIIYTHGIGVVMVPVNEVTAEGQPVLLMKNLPPVSTGGAPVLKEPRIYFGEAKSDYVVVGATQAEFDYPRGDATGSGGETGVPTSWTGTTGIRLDTTFTRLLFALRFRDLDLFISDQLTNQSQLLMHRTLQERLQLLAPFLRYDKDPYLVVNDGGRLVYVQDAYTTSDHFPNAQPFDPDASLDATGIGGSSFDYIRNSVKITMDAYDGTMTFYVADPNDPIIRAYEGIFPSLFKPMTAMPEDLRGHLRVPEELFNVQTRVFGRYHVTDPSTFFRNDDLWSPPSGQTNAQSLPSEAYYVIMRMPGEQDPEFLLLQPMVPTNRPNMIAWVAARNDAPNYGAVRYYKFPSDTTIFGPAQIEARIDQDPVISAQITLWSQSGSTVIRGNLIVVPVGDSLIYLQPVYLQSTSSRFPEFQRIVVASPTTVVWGRTLSEALGLLLQGGGTPGPTPTPGPGPTPTVGPSATPTPGLPSDVAALIAYANDHFEAAQRALRAGDFATYGREIELVREALAKLDALAGPSGAPASPAP